MPRRTSSMNFKTTLVLIVLLAVAGVALYFTSNKSAETKGTHGHDPNMPELKAMFAAWGAGIQPGAKVRAEVGGLGVRLTVDGLPSCEIDREASTHLFVSRA